MRRFRLLLMVTLASAVSFGTVAENVQLIRPRPNIPTVARADPSAATVTPDEVAVLKKRVSVLRKKVLALDSRVVALEEKLRTTTSGPAFTCVDIATSANSAGVTENCAPYTCNYLDGRCRTLCTVSDHCYGATGNRCDTESQRCGPPPAERADDDDDWWPF